MTLDRRKRTIISLLIVCAMLPSALLSMPHSPHHAAWSGAFFILMMLNFAFIAKYQAKHRQPDTLIRLFPVPPDSKERS